MKPELFMTTNIRATDFHRFSCQFASFLETHADFDIC